MEPITRYVPPRPSHGRSAFGKHRASTEQQGAPHEFGKHQRDRVEILADETNQNQIQREEKRADDSHGVTEAHMHEFRATAAAQRHQTNAERADERGHQMLPAGAFARERPHHERHHHAIGVGEEAVASGRRGFQAFELEDESQPVSQREYQTGNDIAAQANPAKTWEKHDGHKQYRRSHAEEHHPLCRHVLLHMLEHGVAGPPYRRVDQHHHAGDRLRYANAFR